jgi:ABC-type Fe3+/spermidine/putrescine transport system ATPase subunit
VQADALFRIERVSLGVTRLRKISLVVPRGATAVLGASGAGKTSLLNLLAGFEKPTSGKLHGDTRVAWVPQNDGLWPDCSAREHLTECGADSAEAERLLAAFDIAQCAKSRPQKLSHGERNRLAVARALAMSPRTLVMDEPLAHVDSARVGKYWRAIREHVVRTGMSFVFATHAPEIALAEAEQAICLREGAVVFSGKVAGLYEQPASEELANFLGPANWLTSDDARRWLGESWSGARCVRPERLMIAPSENGAATVSASRFFGAFAETELRAGDGTSRAFLHRPVAAHEPGMRVSVAVAAIHRA